jgi:hypothetical protein
MPNLQMYFENFIVHDFLGVIVLAILMLKNRLVFSRVFLITALLCSFIIILLYSFEKGSSWLILGRAWVYLSIPILTKEAFKIKSHEIIKSTNKKINLIKSLSFILMFLFLTIHSLQYFGYLSNPFQMDYYMRALGVPMDEDYYKYAWFDEHHVAAPALLSMFFLISQYFQVMI